VTCLQDILDLGVYLTTAVKCAKDRFRPCQRHHSELLTSARKRACPVPECQSLPADGDVGHQSNQRDRPAQRRTACDPRRFHLQDPRRGIPFPGRTRFPSYVQAGPAFS